MIIREEQNSDIEAITEVTIAATEIPLVSLRNAGMSSVMDMTLSASNGSATFDSSNASVAIPMAMSGGGAAVTVAKLTSGDETTIEDHLQEAFGVQESEFNAICNDYIVLGVGQQSQLVGKTMTDAPVHFASNGDMGPDNNYNRFVAVFEVDKANGTTTATDAEARDSGVATECGDSTHAARFVGSGMSMMQGHLFGLAHTLGHTYEHIAAQ